MQAIGHSMEVMTRDDVQMDLKGLNWHWSKWYWSNNGLHGLKWSIVWIVDQ